jgi:chromosome segregation ATPase
MLANQYLVTEAPRTLRGGAYVETKRRDDLGELERLQTKVKTLDAKNKRLREELQKTQLQLADTVVHVNTLQNKLENTLSMQPHVPKQIKMPTARKD